MTYGVVVGDRAAYLPLLVGDRDDECSKVLIVREQVYAPLEQVHHQFLEF